MPNLSCVHQRLLLITCFCFLNFIASYSQELLPTDSLSTILTAKEHEMFATMIDGKKEAAEKLLGSDYITINADGVMEGKASTIATLGKFKGSEVSLSERKIRLYENTAIINGRAKFYMKKILAAEIFYTEIWNYRNGQWQFIGWQGTLTGTPSYYPVIMTVIILLLVYLIFKLIARFRRRSKLRSNNNNIS